MKMKGKSLDQKAVAFLTGQKRNNNNTGSSPQSRWRVLAVDELEDSPSRPLLFDGGNDNNSGCDTPLVVRKQHRPQYQFHEQGGISGRESDVEGLGQTPPLLGKAKVQQGQGKGRSWARDEDESENEEGGFDNTPMGVEEWEEYEYYEEEEEEED
jgi:hypothetical protein